jgi:uncharacterized protein
MPQNYNILCCDGGGIRGLLTALLLQGLPTNAISNATVFAGTSTGGLISIALAGGVSLSDVISLYSTGCSGIFTGSGATEAEVKAYLTTLTGSPDVAEVLWGFIWAGILPSNLFAAKYSNTSLAATFGSTLGTAANTKFGQLATKLFVTTFQLDNGSNQWLPISIDNLTNNPTDSTLLEAALCTSAAPTFFPPYLHSTLGYCVDGGTFANNPSTFVLSRALANGIDPSSIRLLSIGTGQTGNCIPSSYFGTVSPNLWGTYQWMFPLSGAPSSIPSETMLNLMMDGSSLLDDEQSGTILPTGNYLRVEVPLTQPITLDACSEVPTLQNLAKSFMAGPQWTTMQQWVTNNFV